MGCRMKCLLTAVENLVPNVQSECETSKDFTAMAEQADAEDVDKPSSQAECGSSELAENQSEPVDSETCYPDIRIVDLSKICLNDEEPMAIDANSSHDDQQRITEHVTVVQKRSSKVNGGPLQIPPWIRKPSQPPLSTQVEPSPERTQVDKTNSSALPISILPAQTTRQPPTFTPQFTDPNVTQTGPRSFIYAQTIPFFLGQGRYVCGICPITMGPLLITNSEILSHIRTQHGGKDLFAIISPFFTCFLCICGCIARLIFLFFKICYSRSLLVITQVLASV